MLRHGGRSPFYPAQYRTMVPRAYRRALAEGRLIVDDQRLIESFIAEREATRHIGQHRVLKMRYDLISWRRFIPVPFREMTLGDLYTGLNAMKTGTSNRGTPFKQNTKHDLIILLKPFVLWLIESGESSIPAEKVRAIATGPAASTSPTPATSSG